METNQRRTWVLPVAVLFLLLLTTGAAGASARPGDAAPTGAPACRPALAESQRRGFVATESGWPLKFDHAALGAGWVEDMTLGGSAPGLDQVLLLRTPYGHQVNAAWLGPLVDAHPGATWLIGNEPDCIWQDDVPPAEYARIYHDLYTFIKGRDASSRVAAGGIVQPSPLRLQYLDLVLAAYQARYGQALPADLWHIHNAILNEERGGWGADIPPGVDADQGVLRDVEDNDNLAIFQAQVWAFRQWLAGRGYGGYPLLITEFGVLMPAEYGFDAARVAQYMSGTFAFLASASDPVLGDPGDGGRLVQRWAWFSLDVPPYEQDPLGFNGNLFDPATAAITAHGSHYASLTSGLPAVSSPELGLVRWWVEPVGRPVPAGETVTRTVAVRVGNGGTAAAGEFVVRLEYAGPENGTLDLPLAGGLAPSASAWLTFTLAGLPPGAYDLALTLDALNQVAEPAECDNQSSRGYVVPSHLIFLPQVARGAARPPSGRVFGVTAQRAASAGPQAAQAPDRGGPQAAQAPDRAGPAAGDERAGRARVQDPHVLYLPLLASSPFREFVLPQAGSFPGQIALDPASGAVWLTERDGNRLARFDPGSETWTEYDIPTPASRPWGLALDGAGGLWFAETAGNKIGRLDLAGGTMVEYPVPTADCEPWGVAVGGGFVWFTERAGNKIGRLDPATGDIFEYSLATPNAEPVGLTTALQAGVWYVWFVEAAGNRLARLRVADGTLYEPLTQVAGATPQDVVVQGLEAAFTDSTGNNVVIFGIGTTPLPDPEPVPTANSEPYGIAVQGDRIYWFTERAGNSLGRYVPNQPMLEYRLPTPGSAPTDVAIDAAGCVWYAAPGSNRLGRLCLDEGG